MKVQWWSRVTAQPINLGARRGSVGSAVTAASSLGRRLTNLQGEWTGVEK
jgi:hypothetical protein